MKNCVILLHFYFALRRSIQERLEDKLAWAEKVLHTHWDKNCSRGWKTEHSSVR